MKLNRGALIKAVEQPHYREGIPEFRSGDTVRVTYRVVEGKRERLQAFEGVVIKIHTASTPPLPFARSPTARAWSASSPSTRR